MSPDDVPPMTTTDGRDVPVTTAMDERVPLITINDHDGHDDGRMFPDDLI